MQQVHNVVVSWSFVFFLGALGNACSDGSTEDNHATALNDDGSIEDTSGTSTGDDGNTGDNSTPTCNDGAHQPGDNFPSEDGCNTCTCQEDGTISCTSEVCASCRDVEQAACVDDTECVWLEPLNGSDSTLPHAGCYSAKDCDRKLGDSACPAGRSCESIEVDPACGPYCDAEALIRWVCR